MSYDFFEKIIRPNLVQLVKWLRVSEIQRQLMSAKVITDTDNQRLRHEMKIETDKARYLLHEVLTYVDFRNFVELWKNPERMSLLIDWQLVDSTDIQKHQQNQLIKMCQVQLWTNKAIAYLVLCLSACITVL